GASRTQGGRRGNLILTVHINMPKDYERKGNNLYLDHPVDLYTAVLGGESIVNTLSGKVKINIPAGTSSGKLFRLSGMGMSELNNSAKKVYLFASLHIQVSNQILNKERELFERLSKG